MKPSALRWGGKEEKYRLENVSGIRWIWSTHVGRKEDIQGNAEIIRDMLRLTRRPIFLLISYA